MKKILFILTIFLFLNNCGGFEFVYNTSDNELLLKDTTRIIVDGDEAYRVFILLNDRIGYNEDSPKYKLLVNSIQTETAATIDKDATASKFIIKYLISYDLYNLNKNCKILNKKITTYSTYNAKSAGYSFGTSFSQKESITQNINKNITEFISFIKTFAKINNCG